MKKLIICAGGDALMVTPLPPHYTGREIIRPYLRSADFSAVNLEAVLSDYTCFPGAASGGTWVNATPDIFPQLHSFGFDLYGCANNHALDYSYGGLASTCRILEQANVPFCGIGESLEKADAPAICEKNGKKLGVMAVTTTFHDDWRAGRECEDLPSRPGVSFLRHTTIFTVTQTQFDVLDTIAKNATINGSRPLNVAAGLESPDPPGMLTFGKELFLVGEEEKRETFCHPGDLNRILDGVKKASKQLDGLIVLAHSHEVKREAYHEPADFFVEFCHAVLDAGALAVIGGGTHQLKPIEMYHGKPIFYS
ncbi:MAG TPA: hypothetical protein DCY75_05970, partial [Clostridiales bacterium]|nr:hypothetical protein [Clostridiales bacterium]